MTDVTAASSRHELLDRMARGREEFDEVLARVPGDRFLEPGRWGDWTLKDLVAHVAAYERWTAEQMAATPSEEDRAAVEGEASAGVDALNEIIYRDHRDDPLDRVLEESRTAHEALRAAVERLDERDLASPQWWTGGRTLFQIIPEQSSTHYGDHVEDLERAAGG